MVALGHAQQTGRVRWMDGDAAVEVEFHDSEISGVRSVSCFGDAESSSGDGDAATVLPPGLAILGVHSSLFLGAYAAAVSPRSEGLAWLPGRHAAGAPLIPKWRSVAPLVVTAVMGCVAAFAPGVSAIGEHRTVQRHIGAISARRQASAASQAELRKVTEALNEVARFDSSRREVTDVLVALARALPDGAALTSLRLDSAGGMTTVLAPRAATLLARLERSGIVVSPEVLGPVTREMVASQMLERLTVRFRLRDSTSAEMGKAAR